MRWLRGISATVAIGFGLFAGFRAVEWVGQHDYVLALASALVSVAAFRSGAELFAAEGAE